MAPGSAANGYDVRDACKKMFLVIHETQEQTKVVGTYATEEEAFVVAVQKQVGVFTAIEEKMLVQVMQVFPDRSLEWKLRMLQEAMEAFFHDVGFESLADYFHVTNQQVSEPVANKRKMFSDLRGVTKLTKLNSSCGVSSTMAVSSMSRYMYETLPFGRSG